MASRYGLRAVMVALALGLSACGGGGSGISSPGSTNSGSGPGGGGGGSTGISINKGNGQTQTITELRTITAGSITGGNFIIEGDAGVAYRIQGRVDVGVDVGADGTAPGGQSATLTIEPGAVIYGESGSDYIVVNRGSRIVAQGNANNPIIFTSLDDLESGGSTADRTNAISEWGGIVILGRAPIGNCSTGVAAGTVACQQVVEGVTGAPALYGGANPTDDSGILSYVQVRYAGFAPVTDRELNGITFAGVGSGTQVDYVQVHNNSDDGVEFFGGSVNVRHLVLTGNDDDSIDWDAGYNGNIQFAVVKQRSGGGDRLIEASNATGSAIAPLLRSNPTLSNFTFIGARANGITMNSGTSGRLVNGVVVGSTTCLEAGTAAAAPNQPSFNSILFDCSGAYNTASQTLIDAGANNSRTTANSLAGVLPGPTENGVTPVNPTTLGVFFQPANYIGAFSPTETVANNWAAGWTFSLFDAPPCPTGTVTGTLNGQRLCTINAGAIIADLRLPRGNLYRLNGRVDVGVDVGADGSAVGGDAAVLTIEAGAIIFGASGSDYLVVNRGSQIIANGTATSPIVFTSLNDLQGTQADPANAVSEWGGIVLLGRAPIGNCSTGVAAGTVACQQVVEGVTGAPALYGGAISGDSSGSLQYVQVRYAGFAPVQDRELNGITFAGVGSGTTARYIQVHNNSDDGVEFFGGSVNVRYLVLTGNDDDSIDWDAGYSGNIQFAIVRQRSGGGDRLIEASNATGSAIAPLLRSNPTLSNFTFVGARANGITMNSGTSGRLVNGVVVGSTTCLEAGTAAAAPNQPSFNSILFDCSGAYNTASQTLIDAGANNSTTVADTLSEVFVNGPTENGRAAVDPTTLGSFFLPGSYIGAVQNSSDRWWAGWSCGLETATPC